MTEAVAMHAEPAWARALEQHRASVAKLIETIHAVPTARWNEPVAPGKWTPAEIAEHLALSYEAALRELGGGEPMRPKLTPLRRTLLRWILLPHILFHRTLPIAARAPREVRPADTGAAPEEVAKRITVLASRFETAIASAGAARLPGLAHPYFGRIPPLRSLRFITVHLEHHTRQFDLTDPADR